MILKTINTALTVQAALYAAGDSYHTDALAIADAVGPSGGAEIVSVIITNKKDEDIDKGVFFFDGDPSSSTITANAAFSLHDDDLSKLIGYVLCDEYLSVVAGSIDTPTADGGFFSFPFTLTSGTTLYAVVVDRAGATPASTSDLSLRIVLKIDDQDS